MKIIILLSFFIILSAHAEQKVASHDKADQTQLAVTHAVTNFFESPFEYIANASARKKYAEYAEETLAADSAGSTSKEVQCDMQGAPLPESALADLLNIPHISCQCRAWGTCAKVACACEVLCPKNFNIFRRPGTDPIQELTREENSFAFRNIGAQGTCWGHATLTQKFNRLAFFRPDATPPYQLSSTDPEERLKAIKYYKDLIDDVKHNKAVEIPGYADLRTFSDDPELTNYVQDQVMDEWADRAMSWQGLSLGLQTDPKPREQNEALFADVKKRLSLNQQPNIVFTHDEKKFNTHSLLVSQIGQRENREVLCLRDNNFMGKSNFPCLNYMYIGDDGNIVWKEADGDKHDKIGGIEIAFNDNRDAVKQVKSLHKKCKSDKSCRD